MQDDDNEKGAADRVWSRIAGELSRQRGRRRKRRAVLAGISSGAALAIAAFFLSSQGDQESAMVEGRAPVRNEAKAETEMEAGPVRLEASQASTLAVMVWHDGSGRLQELNPADFEDLDFEFNLEPVMAWSDLLE